MAEYVPHHSDDVTLTLTLPATTEEWADDLLKEWDCGDVERTDDGLVVTFTVGGNCNAIANAQAFLSDVEDALADGDIDPMCFTLTAVASPRHQRACNAVESIAQGSRLRNVFDRDRYATVEDHSPARDGQPERWRLSVDAEGPAHEVGWSMDGLIDCWELVG